MPFDDISILREEEVVQGGAYISYYSGPENLPTEDRTAINSEENITFCLSPINMRFTNTAGDNTIQSVTAWLWVWNGAQNATLGKSNFTFEKTKISAADDYINVPVGAQIRSFLENPSNAPNTFQPTFAFNEVSPPAITGQGVFWQVVADITSTAGTVRKYYNTNFCTLGYRWNYEQNDANGNNGLEPYGAGGFLRPVNKWYSPKIKGYISQNFNLTNTVESATASNMINVIDITPPANYSRISFEPVLIVYLNKLGLWEQFTPNGKFTASGSMDFETTNKSFRDPSRVDNSYSHSKQRLSLDVLQSYIINTGSLTEDMVDIVEEILYSDKVYLIKFKGDFQTETFLGLTVDNTYISVDSTNITVDIDVIGAEDLGFYKTFQQIPVTVKTSDFSRKTRVNDKNEINYNILFEETNNKINKIT